MKLSTIWTWLKRQLGRAKSIIGPITLPIVVVVTVMARTGMPAVQTGTKHIGRQMTQGWDAHWGRP
jgi:hypothetical protein